MLQKHKLTPTRGSLFNCSESLNLNIQNITTMYIDQTSSLLIALIITIGASLLIIELLCAKKALARREKDYSSLRKVHERNDKTIRNQRKKALRKWITEVEFIAPTNKYIQFLESGSKNSLTKWQKDVFTEALNEVEQWGHDCN